MKEVICKVELGGGICVREFYSPVQDLIRCKDCKWYDARISMCDNCGLPREQTFFCADGKRRDDDG